MIIIVENNSLIIIIAGQMYGNNKKKIYDTIIKYPDKTLDQLYSYLYIMNFIFWNIID